ncbi:MAG: PDZ domain-containing protein [Proteobacteria bacterium]|nr:PDZ domain-containing protein [Pseudomonadota bacterium]
MRLTLPALFLVSLALPAAAGPPNPYQRTVGLVERLYFYPTVVHEGNVLHGAADELADDVHWLLVDKPDDSTVTLRHGAGAELGTVHVDSMAELPDALAAMEAMVRDAPYGIGDVDLGLSLLDGGTQALDRYSRVLSGDSLARFDVRLKGTIVGIGCNLRLIEDRPRITGITSGGPAERAGMLRDDVLVAVDEVSTTNMPLREITRRIRGEKGSPVTLSILRGERALELSMTREEVVVPNVTHRVLDEGVGYVRIGHFSQRTVQNLSAALQTLSDEGALDKGLVLDLRGNTGGSLRHAARSADQFLLEGLLVRTAGPDGKAVQNLQSRMDAVNTGDEPQVPLVILTDQRTASGSEILAGALVEHGRAALVGTRTYGKGTVQKLYPLGEGASLKLTVAEYVLENDRRISYNGLVSDIVVGQIELDEHGARWERGWDEAHQQVAFEDVLPAVREEEAWRGQSHNVDIARELARRAVLIADAPTRDETVLALRIVAGEMRASQDAQLEEALSAREIDWTVPPLVEGHIPSTDVHITAEAAGDDQYWVHAEVQNQGDSALGQVLVELESPSFSGWDELRIPLGRLEAGATGTGKVRVDFRPGIHEREDEVSVKLRAANHEPWSADSTVLSLETGSLPELTVNARLLTEGAPRVEVVIDNHGRVPIEDLDVFFRAPGDMDVELVDRAVRIPNLPPRSSERVELRIELGAEAPPDALPLLLIAENQNYGELLEHELLLPLNGEGLRLQEPVVAPRNPPLSAPVGELTLAWDASDDERIAHVVVYVNGDKSAWVPGGDPLVPFRTPIDVLPGVNRVVAIATDSSGLKHRRQVVIRGEQPTEPDAAVTHEP